MPLSHLGIVVSHIPTATSFYLAALQPLGYHYIGQSGQAVGLGVDKADFFLHQDPKSHAVSPTHVAFDARDCASVRKCYTAALNAGAYPSQAPGRRNGDFSVFAAAVEDPDGNVIEFVCKPSTPSDTMMESQALYERPSASSRTLGSVESVPSTSASTSAPPNNSSGFPGQAVLGTILGAAAGATLAWAVTKAEHDNAKAEASFARSVQAPHSPKTIEPPASRVPDSYLPGGHRNFSVTESMPSRRNGPCSITRRIHTVESIEPDASETTRARSQRAPTRLRSQNMEAIEYPRSKIQSAYIASAKSRSPEIEYVSRTRDAFANTKAITYHPVSDAHSSCTAESSEKHTSNVERKTISSSQPNRAIERPRDLGSAPKTNTRAHLSFEPLKSKSIGGIAYTPSVGHSAHYKSHVSGPIIYSISERQANNNAEYVPRRLEGPTSQSSKVRDLSAAHNASERGDAGEQVSERSKSVAYHSTHENGYRPHRQIKEKARSTTSHRSDPRAKDLAKSAVSIYRITANDAVEPRDADTSQPTVDTKSTKYRRTGRLVDGQSATSCRSDYRSIREGNSVGDRKSSVHQRSESATSPRSDYYSVREGGLQESVRGQPKSASSRRSDRHSVAEDLPDLKRRDSGISVHSHRSHRSYRTAEGSRASTVKPGRLSTTHHNFVGKHTTARSHLSAAQVPLPGSDDEKDDGMTVLPEDSISCVDFDNPSWRRRKTETGSRRHGSVMSTPLAPKERSGRGRSHATYA
ncbi:hypothetical protein K470DRAFT_266552 [Piedraia hortae CBS 480.64]|uniref:VOC domain-containing protein n=1 Tax=Piedraia hortae CBS 480.64 TaxID=1314780 RepID=A0A6A7BSW6_9PEZI|nr:hypothetical protein K470DRAFT_266552 [Piedraia hortae CBS 480.64]